jgi:hypothetical protein
MTNGDQSKEKSSRQTSASMLPGYTGIKRSQRPKPASDAELGVKSVKGKSTWKMDEEPQDKASCYSPKHKQIILTILVGCTALVFILWTLAAIFELLTKGNSSLLTTDGVPTTLFMMVMHRFLNDPPSRTPDKEGPLP